MLQYLIDLSRSCQPANSPVCPPRIPRVQLNCTLPGSIGNPLFRIAVPLLARTWRRLQPITKCVGHPNQNAVGPAEPHDDLILTSTTSLIQGGIRVFLKHESTDIITRVQTAKFRRGWGFTACCTPI